MPMPARRTQGISANTIRPAILSYSVDAHNRPSKRALGVRGGNKVEHLRDRAYPASKHFPGKQNSLLKQAFAMVYIDSLAWLSEPLRKL